MATILCIEDNPDIREDIVSELEDAGHTVVEAANGNEGLNALGCKPDLILSDVNMPVMDGHKLVVEVREKYPEFADTPFIFLSAYAEREDILAGKAVGADDYISKPVDYDLLRATIDSRLRQVKRMVAKRDHQFIHLYKILSDENAGRDKSEILPCSLSAPKSVRPVTVAIISNFEIDFSELHGALHSRGHNVIILESGLEFVESVKRISPDIAIVSFNTKDIQAPNIMHMISASDAEQFPVVLAMPPNMQVPMSMVRGSQFSDTVSFPCNTDDFIQRIEVLSIMRQTDHTHTVLC